RRPKQTQGSFGENLHQKEPRDILGEPHQNVAQPNDTLLTTWATQRIARQKRARSSPERNPHQDNNKRFWETSSEHKATKRCTSASRAVQQQPEMGTTQFWGNLTPARTNREELREHLTRAHNQPVPG
ncbi:hypothetical protein Taro_033678, partial [Colocasia esculenta]|nr:hypothetical protein [Colocasia esculenta]